MRQFQQARVAVPLAAVVGMLVLGVPAIIVALLIAAVANGNVGMFDFDGRGKTSQ